jgi:hypothetical protein
MDAPSARHVGICFITEYYQRLHKDPSKLRQLYHEVAEFSFGEGDEDVMPIAGLEAISAEIERIGNARVDLTAATCSVDCQHSHDGGVMVMVCGVLTLSGQQPKQFVQSFFLARVPPNSYVIRNSSLRMIGDALSSTPPVASGAPTQPVVVKEVKKHAEAPAKEPAADIPDDADTAKEEQQIEPKATVKEAVAEVHAPAAQAEPEAKVEVAEKPSAPVKSGGIVWGGKQTIADLFKDGNK